MSLGSVLKKVASPIAKIAAPITAFTSGGLLGGGGGQPQFDFGNAGNMIAQNAAYRKSLTDALYGTDLPKVTADYKSGTETAGQQYLNNTKGAAQTYAQGLQGLGAEDKAASDLAYNRSKEQAYRDLPGQQQQIREALAATGNLNTGRAGTTLAKPILQTQQRLSDLQSVLEQQGLDKQSARREAGLQAIYETDKGAALNKLGLDQDTLRTLLANGRTDLISKAANLAGISQDEVNAMLGLQAGQFAAQQNAADRKNALVRALGSLAGGIGGGFATKSPAGVSAGAGIGGSLGDIFAGLS